MFTDEKYNKIFQNLKALAKNDLSLDEAFNILHKPDASHEDRAKASSVFKRHIYFDTLVPRVGNVKAYRDFLTRNKDSGVHLSLDGNSFGAINKEHGFEAGDAAIKHIFNTVSTISRKHGLKCFRVGGDEGRLHAPNEEKAKAFVNELRSTLGESPPVSFNNEEGHEVNTGHKASVSVGIGYTPEHAEKALIHAKDQLGPLGADGKRSKYNPPGKEQTVHHSLLHETPPPHWRPFTGNTPSEPEPTQAAPAPGLKYSNPLKKP